ncbi:VOC family protein [Falsiroseomonas oryziterrae]|uniref:VOC family protein n=1 Tax=Falsiroseomonas oryziterrae TaxID=2911368 RepID=UPI001F1C9855|nr:hypothetical protein [Roseomonas sp. NPKOSM-4]
MSFGRGLSAGLGVNLLVPSVAEAVGFQTAVLGAIATYAEEQFAVMRCEAALWLLHSDHAYRRHPFSASVRGLEARGGGVELRLYGQDPDAAEARARDYGAPVIATAEDKPHGLREAYLLDPAGYVWVPCRPI